MEGEVKGKWNLFCMYDNDQEHGNAIVRRIPPAIRHRTELPSRKAVKKEESSLPPPLPPQPPALKGLPPPPKEEEEGKPPRRGGRRPGTETLSGER